MSLKLNPRVSYLIDSGNANKVKFDFSFPVLSTDDVKVILSDGTVPIGYSVKLLKDKSGGSISLTNPIAVGMNIIIYRDMPYTRQTKFRENEDFRASVINEEFDRIIMLLQQSGRSLKDCIRTPLSESSVNMILPNSKDRAGKVLGFDNSGRPELLQSLYNSMTIAKQHAGTAGRDAIETLRNRRYIDGEILSYKAQYKLDKQNLENIKNIVVTVKNTVASDKLIVEQDRNIVASDKALISQDKKDIENYKTIITNDKTTIEQYKQTVASDKAIVQADKALVAKDKQIVVNALTQFPNVSSLAKTDLSNIDVTKSRHKLNLGTASEKNVGTNNGNIPIIGSNGKIDSSVLPTGKSNFSMTTLFTTGSYIKGQVNGWVNLSKAVNNYDAIIFEHGMAYDGWHGDGARVSFGIIWHPNDVHRHDLSLWGASPSNSNNDTPYLRFRGDKDSGGKSYSHIYWENGRSSSDNTGRLFNVFGVKF